MAGKRNSPTPAGLGPAGTRYWGDALKTWAALEFEVLPVDLLQLELLCRLHDQLEDQLELVIEVGATTITDGEVKKSAHFAVLKDLSAMTRDMERGLMLLRFARKTRSTQNPQTKTPPSEASETAEVISLMQRRKKK